MVSYVLNIIDCNFIHLKLRHTKIVLSLSLVLKLGRVHISLIKDDVETAVFDIFY